MDAQGQGVDEAPPGGQEVAASANTTTKKIKKLNAIINGNFNRKSNSCNSVLLFCGDIFPENCSWLYAQWCEVLFVISSSLLRRGPIHSVSAGRSVRRIPPVHYGESQSLSWHRDTVLWQNIKTNVMDNLAGPSTSLTLTASVIQRLRNRRQSAGERRKWEKYLRDHSMWFRAGHRPQPGARQTSHWLPRPPHPAGAQTGEGGATRPSCQQISETLASIILVLS